MAGIGMYGVFYSKCVKSGGVVTGYDGKVKMMGKAVSANFAANTPEDNPLYANNSAAENDVSSGSGGTLTNVLDRMSLDTAADLYGTTVSEVTAKAGSQNYIGKEITYKGLEVSTPVGVAYIRLHQEDGVRSHEVVFYREVTYTRPGEEAQTMGRTIEWKTPSITGTVSGMQGDGSEPWYRISRWESQEAAIAYIYNLFGAEVTEAALAEAMEAMSELEEEPEGDDVTV